jgi:hypothetical protein
MPRAPRDFATFEANAADVAQVLRALANERRLMILCSWWSGERQRSARSPKP